MIGWPQALFLGWLFMGLGLHLGRNGQPIPHNYSFWRRVAITTVIIVLLWQGGFFH